jgi:hypothetical protein
MSIKAIQVGQPGNAVTTSPQWIYIDTNDTLSTVTTSGYLNGAVNEYINTFTPRMMALVSTRSSQSTGAPIVLYELQVQNNNGVWSLVNPATRVPQVASIVMNTAAVIGAYAAPYSLIPSQGTTSTIMLLSAQVITEVSTAFATGGIAQIQYGATVHGGGTIATSATIAAAEITASSSQIFTMAPIAAATVMATASFKNLGIYFTNATQPFTNGAGSTVTAVLTYIVIPTV